MSDDENKQETSNSNNTKKESVPDFKLTKDEEELLKKKIEELRKRDPFIYR